MSLGSLLQNADILPRILAHLPRQEHKPIRLICHAVRDVHDKHATSIHLREEPGRPLEELKRALLGILSRGCRPTTLSLLVNAPTPDVYQHTIELLSVFRGFHRPTPLPTRELHLNAAAMMLGEGLARSLVATLPKLEALTLQLSRGGPDAHEEWRGILGDQSKLAANLAHLACPREGLRHLTRLELRIPDGPALSPDLSAALSGATQLREILLPMRVADLEAAAPLSTLCSLQSLSLGDCAPHLLAPLLSPLTGLTSLRLESTCAELTAAHLAGLPCLAVLWVGNSTLSVSALAQLSRLVELHVNALVLSDEDQQALQATPQTCDWRLPANLTRFKLDYQAPEVLSAISRWSQIRRLEWDTTFVLRHNFHHDPDTGALTEHGEGALISAFQALTGRMSETSNVMIVANGPLLPVGGAAALGPGRRNHTPWLEAVARSGVPELILNCDPVLTHQDLATLASNTLLTTLELYDTVLRPFAGLMALSGAPRLETLVVDTHDWFAGELHDGPFEPPGAAEGVILALLLACPRLSVGLSLHGDAGRSAEAQDGLREMLEGMQSDLEAMGDDRERLWIY